MRSQPGAGRAHVFDQRGGGIARRRAKGRMASVTCARQAWFGAGLPVLDQR
jgi:hypothetical protein